jgi:hypothetical protein
MSGSESRTKQTPPSRLYAGLSAEGRLRRPLVAHCGTEAAMRRSRSSSSSLTLSPEFQESALAAVQTRLDNGDHPMEAGRAVRLLQAYELMFWAALSDDA